jgi:ribonuclease-3
MVSKEKKIFHYDIYEDNGIDGTRFGVKLSIDGKVIAKARATSKKEKPKKRITTHLFCITRKKWTKNNIIFIKLHRFRS